ncbi:MAG: GspH/FimT family pseudopilin [Moraxellaceae bacterium]
MKKMSGFTLIELLFVILITCLLSFMAAGMWSGLQLRMEARSVIAMLANSLFLARNTAISTQMPVTVCGSRNATACDGQWQSGVLVFSDVNGNESPSVTAKILGFYPAASPTSVIAWRGFGSKTHVRFDRMGRTSASNGGFIYCPGNKDAHYARQVIINRGGRVRFSTDRDGDGMHEDSSGNTLRCP